MGVFAAIVHIRGVTPEALREALDALLAARGFKPEASLNVPAMGPSAIRGFEELVASHPSYLLSTAPGSLGLTLIEASFAVEGTPWLSELSAGVGKLLGAYTLSFMVHDDDVLYYNLDHAGQPLDGYNSCPQYFEQERLAESEVESQRHTPIAFRPLLLDSASLSHLQQVLDRGWWRAHDLGQLDDDGVPVDDDDTLGSEAQRVVEVADILGIPGDVTPYPYADWRSSSTINWPSFGFVAYSRGEGAG